jgi:hypothetical protein
MPEEGVQISHWWLIRGGKAAYLWSISDDLSQYTKSLGRGLGECLG